MESSNKNRITEKEIIRAIRQVGEDSEMIEAFKSVSEPELKAILQQERDRKRKARTLRIGFYPVFSIAAAFLVLLLLRVFILNSPSPPSPPDFYVVYFDMPVYQSTISRGPSERSESFFDLYTKGLYEEALDEIKSVDDDDLADEPLLKFYVSVCYMKTCAIPKATQYLSELHAAYPHWPEVQWYLALGYLNEKQTDKAKELLQKMDDEMYADKAKELLQKMDDEMYADKTKELLEKMK